MKITKKQLKQFIKEERAALQEQTSGRGRAAGKRAKMQRRAQAQARRAAAATEREARAPAVKAAGPPGKVSYKQRVAKQLATMQALKSKFEAQIVPLQQKLDRINQGIAKITAPAPAAKPPAKLTGPLSAEEEAAFERTLQPPAQRMAIK